MDYRFGDVPLIDFIKTITIYKGLTLRKLLKLLHENYGFSNSYAGFYNKLKNNTLKLSEVKDITDALGYEIIFKSKA